MQQDTYYSQGIIYKRTTQYANDVVGLTQVLIASEGANDNPPTQHVYNLFGLDLISQDDGNEVRTLLVDSLGSVRTEMVDEVVETVTTYSPYGEVLEQVGMSGTVYGFTGEQEDGATGLLYLRARYYDSSLKTFMSRDPWEGTGWQPATLNYYTYVLGNPVLYTDPSGHCIDGITTVPCVVIAGGVVVVIGTGIVVHHATQQLLDTPFVQEGIEDLANATGGFFDTLGEEVAGAIEDCRITVQSWRDLEATSVETWRQPQPTPRPTQAPLGPDIFPSRVPDDDSPKYLYHYTPAANIAGIIATGLRPSIEDPNNPASDAQWGDGHYFTDLTPDEASSATRYQVAYALFSVPWKWGRPPNLGDIGWLKIDVEGLDIQWKQSLFGERFSYRSIFLHPSTNTLPVHDRIGGTGVVRFQASASGYR